MTIRVALHHRTTYRFAEPVTVHPHVVRLRPAPHSRTPIQAYSLTVSPADHFINWQQDAFGNYLARLVFPERVSELDICVDLVADMTVINPFDFFVEEYAETFPFSYPPELRADLEPYLRPVDDGAEGSGPSERVRAWVDEHIPVPATPMRIVDWLVAANRAVHDAVGYTVRMQPGVQTPQESLDSAIGSCRDSAWLLVSALRQRGLAARFVSGYLVQLTADQESLDGPNGPSADFTDLHAWAEVYVPGAGWLGLDATSGLFAGEGHIPLCATPHPSSAAPITGATAPVEVSFAFENSVTRIFEDPRVTKPYTEDQWQRVQSVGQHVDRLLADGDVRLTMGGEPTFVSVDDTATPQWETAADGEDKRERARELAARLRPRWAPKGLVHHGQGKWYPGEPLPRWQIALLWRTDDAPLWRDPDLLDDPWGEPRLEPGSVAAAETVRRLTHEIASRLGIPADVPQPAYEDRVNAWLGELRQPAGERPGDDVDPTDPRADRVTALDEQPGLPTGWVVPVFVAPDGDGWGTTRWRTRRAHLFLTPGTSPMGLRLPLGSISWTEGPDQPEASPFAARGPLPAAEPVAAQEVPPAQEVDIDEAPRTALTVEEREGHLFVFLPPLAELDDAVALIGAVESAAAAVGIPVVLEGYPPPGDPRLRTLTVTPDPGVIEVNVQPTSTWGELETLTTTLFEDARQSRLTTEKFDLDGTHTGTGGGNHITLGGPTAADSPLLRRPDLLRSLITYWQHHPGLSYLFSGRFIGPTSQSPRVDEGRHETLYELEIAFAELERVSAEGEVRPWLVDRLLRHLLTDITGNTHRSEFCIDKLYAPGTERGRLGLLEMRGFEMPPHPQMSLVQALLVRALVARFWDRPYAGPLVRWGSRLHDRFLLPAFVAADLREVASDLTDYLGPQHPFDPTWLDPFLEFRFPRLGETDVAGVHLELRQAVEPWHVLGEEVSQSGTARYVDSSVEKVQLAATGLVEGRHVVTCNGIPVPLVPVSGSGWGGRSPGTGSAPDTHVGGVRYRAWAPPSALHPTIGVHSPLVFDLVDRWNERSLGGFTYHVVHPGGRAYDRYPVNAAEAESRRAGRFEPIGHSTGRIDTSGWPATEARVRHGSGEQPTTLDLRRFSPGIPSTAQEES
ncbi:transglutaminase family protein [Calidifontibacter sp. DB0510]|uniref:Transglutaminase family protein n=1 Tax=Metallococcus carri TaxID=1656884 RepID=A0A967E9H1_9MICO|nr:transglutaminase family protein [Metallococcus carri]NHN54859.1 transglutaminase family protein [Metallococcus carri]NOP37204.1 transglutaminase family protein [Calidifontibacter sp. DB2511S]